MRGARNSPATLSSIKNFHRKRRGGWYFPPNDGNLEGIGSRIGGLPSGARS